VITGVAVPAFPSWLLEPLWDQFAVLLPGRPVYDPSHPLGCRRSRILFEKLIQVLRSGCSCEPIAGFACSAATIRERRSEWIKAGIFARLKQIALEAYDRIAGLRRARRGAFQSRSVPVAVCSRGAARQAIGLLELPPLELPPPDPVPAGAETHRGISPLVPVVPRLAGESIVRSVASYDLVPAGRPRCGEGLPMVCPEQAREAGNHVCREPLRRTTGLPAGSGAGSVHLWANTRSKRRDKRS
jgi:transposase